MEEGYLVYSWVSGRDIDPVYYSQAFGVRIAEVSEGTEVPALDAKVTRAKISCPLLQQLEPLQKDLPNGKKARAEAERLFREQVVDQLSLVPCPAYPSPLLMCLMQAFEGGRCADILMDSFECLRLLCKYERILWRCSKLGKEAKEQVLQTRDTFLTRIAEFSRLEGGLHRVFLMPPVPNLNTEKAFLKEDFFTTVNAMRVLEFTMLDYLQVPEAEQDSYAAYAATSLPKSAAIRKVCWEALHRSLTAQHPELRPSIEACTVKSGRFIPAALLQQHMGAVKREVVKRHTFPCSNSGSCAKQETSTHRFMRCSRCSWCRYCSKQCQTAHWTLHRLECGKDASLDSLDKNRLLIGAKG